MNDLPRAHMWLVLLASPLLLLLNMAGLAPRTSAQETLAARPVPPSCFSQMSSPNPGSGDNSLFGVSALPSGEAWAVGAYANGGANQPLTLHWDGLNWVGIPSPSISSATLLGVSAVASNDVWAVGSYSSGMAQTLTLHWDGTAWSQISSPNPGSTENGLFSVTVLSSSDAWAVGKKRSGILYQTLILHWDGSTWTPVPSPNPGTGDNLLFGVSGVATDDVWAVGWYADGSTNRTLVLHWNGTAWIQVPSPSPGAGPNRLVSIGAATASNIWAVGTTSPGTLILHWDGTAWSQVPSPNPGSTSVSLNGVSALPSGDAWVVGTYANGGPVQTLALHWDGLTWVQVPSPNVGTNDNALNGVSVVSARDIKTVGYYSNGTTNRTLILNACPDATATAAAQTPSTTMTPTGTASPAPTNTPTATPTIAGCADVVWTNRINTTVVNGALTKNGGMDGQWDAGATTTLGILNTPACFRIDPGVIMLGAERIIGLTHNEHSPGIDDIDYGIYLGATGTLGVVDGGQLVPGNFGSYAAGDSFQIAIEGAPLVANYYHNGQIYYTSTRPPQLPLLGDASIATLGGAIGPAHICGNGAQATATSLAATQTVLARPTNTPGGPTATTTPCALTFSDVHPPDYFAYPVNFLACRGVISGYADGTFRPYNPTTRSQQVKIVVLGFGLPSYTPPAGGYLFADVPPSFPFYPYIETAAHVGIISGYTCGGVGEPCDGLNRPYFRPYMDVTRGQLSKIVVAAAGWSLLTPAAGSFADVAPGTAFYPFVETAVCHGIISGYACGTLPGEPCDGGNRPYFRQANNATRGQIAKIVFGALTSTAACPTAR